MSIWQYPGYPVQQGFAYSAPPIAAAQFDAGARFDGIASQNIPVTYSWIVVCVPSIHELCASHLFMISCVCAIYSWLVVCVPSIHDWVCAIYIDD